MRHWLSWGLLALVIGGAGFYLLTARFQAAPLPAYLVAINVATFIVYALDKWASKITGASRAPNLLLLLLGLAGGTIAALVAVYGLPHKSGEGYPLFRAFLWLILFGQLFVAYCRLADEGGQCQALCGRLGQWLSGSPGD